MKLPPPIGQIRPQAFVAGEPRKRGRPKTLKPECIIAKCEKRAATRGLCPAHYMNALHRIKKGTTTWETLEAKGLAVKLVDVKSKALD